MYIYTVYIPHLPTNIHERILRLINFAGASFHAAYRIPIALRHSSRLRPPSIHVPHTAPSIYASSIYKFTRTHITRLRLQEPRLYKEMWLESSAHRVLCSILVFVFHPQAHKLTSFLPSDTSSVIGE